MKKQYYFLFIILIFSISCQSKEDKDSLTFSPVNYSYKGYDIIPYEASDIDFTIGDEYIVMYSMNDDNYLLTPLKVESIENKEVFYDGSVSPVPVFNILDLNKKYQRQYIDTEEYIFLFKGLKDKKERISKELFPVESNGDVLILDYMDEKYKLIQNVGKKIYDKQEEEEVLKDVTYSMQTSSHKQNLFRIDEINSQTSVFLLYIGDIDNDSKPDLIFRIRRSTDDDISKNYFMMFLTSEAQDGKIIKHVATRLDEYKMLVIIDDKDSSD